MTSPRKLLFASGVILGLASVVPPHAHAGLLGAGNTVQAFYYKGVFAGPEGEIPVAASTSDPASLATAVDYQQGSADISLIHVGDTQIVITNESSGFPFCFANTAGTACKDVIDGFDFKFTGENILGVSADFSSAASFLPVSGTFQGNTHLGLELLSNNEIQVDVTGDLPNLGDKLVLNLSFTATPPTSVPEPGTLALLGTALAGLMAVRRRKSVS